MVIVLQFYDAYQESIFDCSSEIDHVLPIITSTEIFCVAGFRPGRRGFAWRVPKGATVVVEAKDPKPVTPRPATSDGADASLRRADQLALLKQGPPVVSSVPPWPNGRRRIMED